jgi:acetyl-CoA carboxylase carboxyltransferase component
MSGEEKRDLPRVSVEQVRQARAALEDAARPDAVARQKKRGRWTAREGIAALTDEGSFVEYGGLVRPALADMQAPPTGW